MARRADTPQIGRKLYYAVRLGDGRVERTYPGGQKEIVREVVVLEDVETGDQAVSTDTVHPEQACAGVFAHGARLRIISEFLREEDVAALQEGRGRYDAKTRAVR